MISPEPIVRNDFVEEAQAFIHSVRGHVLIQRLVVPGHDIDDQNDDCNMSLLHLEALKYFLRQYFRLQDRNDQNENTDANGNDDEYMDVNDDDNDNEHMDVKDDENEYMDVNDDDNEHMDVNGNDDMDVNDDDEYDCSFNNV